MKITKQELENSKPGICVTCGKYESLGRSTIGECLDCYNKAVLAYREQRKKENAQKKEEGRRYWAEKGISPGDKVKRYAQSLIGFCVMEVTGIAKVGANGAYVHIPGMPGQYDPAGWGKVE